MISVNDLITRLKLGELRQTKFATVDATPIGTANLKSYLAAINKAVTHLYSLFDLREGQFRLVQVEGRVEYTLDDAASLTNNPDIGFVADTSTVLFNDHEVMQIQACVLSDGTGIKINDPTDRYSVFIDKFNRIQIPNPVDDVDYIFTYKAYHPKITGLTTVTGGVAYPNIADIAESDIPAIIAALGALPAYTKIDPVTNNEVFLHGLLLNKGIDTVDPVYNAGT